MTCGLHACVLYKNHEEASHSVIETSQNITLIAQRDIARSIEILSLSLDALRNRYNSVMYRELTRNQKQTYLFGGTAVTKQAVVMAVLDRTGRVVVSSLPGAVVNTDRDRPYFSVHRDRSDVGLYISKPFTEKLAKDMQVIVLSKRLSNADGSFSGIVLMMLDLSYFQELFSGITLGEGGVMSVYSRDGVTYMRLPYSASVIGLDVSNSASFLQMKPLIQQQSGSFFARSASDGIDRLYTFRKIPETPLIVVVGRAEKDIYKHWTDILYIYTSIVLLFVSTFFVLYWILGKELKKRFSAEEKLRQLASIDGLTNLPNRRALDNFLRDLWKHTRRSTGTFSILFIDVDYFKFYNDTYGHQKGDEVLVVVARCISEQSPRSSDMVARYGGEEFIAVLAETDAHGAMVVGGKIRHAIEALDIPHSHSPYAHLTVSIGAATYNRRVHRSMDEILKAADGALYDAKEKGRNNIQLSMLHHSA